MEKIIVVFSALLIGAASSYQFTQPGHAGLTQIASVGCSLENNFTMTFLLDTVNDTVVNIYTVNSTDSSQTTHKTFNSTITGSGTSSDPFRFSISAGGSLAGGLTLSQMDLNNFAYITEPDVLTVNVMVKSQYDTPFYHQAIFRDDVLYVVTCNFSAVQDYVVKSQALNVTGYIDEIPKIVQENAIMTVVDNSTMQAVTTVPLNTPIFLQIALVQPTTATGLYAHSCVLCDTPTCTGGITPVQFIGADGCAVGNIISKFTYSDAVTITTGVYQSFALYTYNNIYMRCNVNFCYAPSQRECMDYCLANSNGRRKRQAVENTGQVTAQEDELVVTELRILVEGGGQSGPALENRGNEIQAQTAENMALLGTVVALAAVFIVGAIAAVFYFCRVVKPTKLIQS